MKKTILLSVILNLAFVSTALPSFNNGKNVGAVDIAKCCMFASHGIFVVAFCPAALGNVACQKVAAVSFYSTLACACLVDKFEKQETEFRESRMYLARCHQQHMKRQ